MPNLDDSTRLRQLLAKPESYSDAEIEELRKLSPHSLYLAQGVHAANFRASVELIAAIRTFDNASATMVKRGNLINTWVLVFAIAAAVLGGGAFWIAVLSYQLALAQGPK